MLDFDNLCAAASTKDAPITDPHDLPEHLCSDPNALVPAVRRFPMRISPQFLATIQNPHDPLARQVIPDPRELEDPCDNEDPLAEESQSPAPLIIHRYPQRVIFLVSNQCAVHCRFCMRKRRVGHSNSVTQESLTASIRYIQEHCNINEVILSGGDPLMLDDAKLKTILTAIHRIPHIRVIRIHTRIPCVWPERLTPELVELLSSFHPLYINIHFNHPLEINTAVIQGCALLANAGIPLGSQTVLLKGINDDDEVLKTLFEQLLAMRVRPYYLHQVDRVPGTAHFHVPLERGLDMFQRLRGRLSGMGVPHFMVDLPQGGGKMALLPESVLARKKGHWVVQNYQGRLYTLKYP